MVGGLGRLFRTRSRLEASPPVSVSPTEEDEDDQQPPDYVKIAHPGDKIQATSEKATFIEKSVSKHSQAHCDCSRHLGCCRQHNAITNLTLYTLTPIHTSMNYHLAFGNLACMRDRLYHHNTRDRYIPELSWKDSAETIWGTDYKMRAETFWSGGTFLQIQEMQCDFHRAYAHKSKGERFMTCPHHGVSISRPAWRRGTELLEVQLDITNHPPRCASHASQRWSNLGGQHAHIVTCAVCHADGELMLWMRGAYLRVQFTSYRDLGGGKDPLDPKWRALFRGEGDRTRPDGELDLYMRVWRTASLFRLRRMETTAYQTPNGLVDLASG